MGQFLNYKTLYLRYKMQGWIKHHPIFRKYFFLQFFFLSGNRRPPSVALPTHVSTLSKRPRWAFFLRLSMTPAIITCPTLASHWSWSMATRPCRSHDSAASFATSGSNAPGPATTRPTRQSAGSVAATISRHVLLPLFSTECGLSNMEFPPPAAAHWLFSAILEPVNVGLSSPPHIWLDMTGCSRNPCNLSYHIWKHSTGQTLSWLPCSFTPTSATWSKCFPLRLDHVSLNNRVPKSV